MVVADLKNKIYEKKRADPWPTATSLFNSHLKTVILLFSTLMPRIAVLNREYVTK